MATLHLALVHPHAGVDLVWQRSCLGELVPVNNLPSSDSSSSPVIDPGQAAHRLHTSRRAPPRWRIGANDNV
jgi:hypothetical protein